jgi:hypothetical protein
LYIFDLDLVLDEDPDCDLIAGTAAAEGWTDLVRYATALVCNTLGRPSDLPRRIARWSLKLIESIWSRDLLLQGEDRAATSMRQESALGLLLHSVERTSTRRRGVDANGLCV